MATYIVPLDIEVQAEDAECAIERARQAVGHAYDLLVGSSYEPDVKAAEVIGSAEYGEPYLLDAPLPESIGDDGSIARY